MIDGITSQPFSAQTLPPLEDKKQYQEDIIKNCRTLYARPREEVEKEILNKRNRRSFLTDKPNEQRLF